VKAFIITAVSSAIIGTIATMNTYSRTRNVGRAVVCGAWISFQGIVGGFAWFMPMVAGVAWGGYRAVLGAVGGYFIC